MDDCQIRAGKGGASFRFWANGLLGLQSFRALGVRVFVLGAVAAVFGFNYAVLGPTIRDLTASPAANVSTEEIMKKPGPSMPHQLQVSLRVIPEKQQRYDTTGDWQWSGNALEIRVSREVADKDPRYAMLVFVHELIEAILCRIAGVTTAQVDSFDMSHPHAEEPGDDPAAPYHRQHLAAQAAERALAENLGVNWNDYLSR